MIVLVAEDDHGLSVEIKDRLENAGHEVIVALHGGEAFEIILSDDFAVDAVITDMNMPKMSGAEILQALSTVPKKPPPTLLHSSETSGRMSNHEMVDLEEFIHFFVFAQFHKKERDLHCIDEFLASIKK